MATELEEGINAALNTPTGQEAAHVDPDPVDPDPEDPDPVDLDPEDPTDPDPEPEDRPVSRSQQRIQKLAEERTQEKALREAAERERDFYRQQALQTQRKDPPEEELDADEKWRRDANAVLQRTQLMATDMADKAEFLTKYQKNPDVLAMAQQVEAKLAEARKQGGNTTRENMLKYLMGERALERSMKAPVVKKQAADRVNAARGTPLGTRSNVASSGRAEPTLAERLKDQPL